MEDKNKYTQILLWAFHRKESGFTLEELESTFKLNDREKQWVRKIFLTISDTDRKFFEHYFNDNTLIPNKHYYSLNEKGISAALSASESQHMKSSNQIVILIAIFGAIVGFVSLGVAIWTGSLTQKGLEETRRSLEIASQPTISLNTQADNYGSVNFASSTIDFTLKNTSLTSYSDIYINISLFQTYYDSEARNLIIGPVAQFWNENNEIFRSYSLLENSTFTNQSLTLAPLQEWHFELDPSGFIEDKGICPVEPDHARVYHDKFKYFFRVDIQYKREIDNVNYRYVKYYSIDKEWHSDDLDRRKDALNWIIDENDDGNAIFIVPFKSNTFIKHLDSNPPPYSDFPLEHFAYNPINDRIYLNPTGSRTVEMCFMLRAESIDSIKKIKREEVIQ